jgi:hypothetical protein
LLSPSLLFLIVAEILRDRKGCFPHLPIIFRSASQTSCTFRPMTAWALEPRIPITALRRLLFALLIMASAVPGMPNIFQFFHNCIIRADKTQVTPAVKLFPVLGIV